MSKVKGSYYDGQDDFSNAKEYHEELVDIKGSKSLYDDYYNKMTKLTDKEKCKYYNIPCSFGICDECEVTKMQAKYNKIVRRGYEYKPIMELNEVDSDVRICNCCFGNRGIRKELMVGCNNSATSICLCEQCLIILHDMIDELLDGIENA